MGVERWIDVGALSALEAAGHLDVEVSDLPVTIVRAAGRLHAFEDRCSHDGEPLAGAEIDAEAPGAEAAVICPRHGARFCLRTGAALTPPAYEPIRVFQVRATDGRVEVRLPVTSGTGPRRLTLVRHGRAEDKGPGHRDFDRALDPRGAAEVGEMARRCRDGGLLPQLLLASAALRTMQTAQAFQRLLAPAAPPLRVESGLYLAEADTLLAHIRDIDDAVTDLMVIAHNPGLGDLAAQLAPAARFAGFETGATFTMAFPSGSWRDLRPGLAQDFRYDSPGRFYDTQA